jgi:hypothetical protein
MTTKYWRGKVTFEACKTKKVFFITYQKKLKKDIQKNLLNKNLFEQKVISQLQVLQLSKPTNLRT